jgi:hypothetical protein
LISSSGGAAKVLDEAIFSVPAAPDRRATAVLRDLYNGEGKAFENESTAFQTAKNLIVLIAEAASRIANPVAHSKSYVALDKEFCMSRETHLAALGQRHDALDKEIAKELVHPAKDELKLTELKRRKLQLKDEIAKLQCDRPFPSMH